MKYYPKFRTRIIIFILFLISIQNINHELNAKEEVKIFADQIKTDDNTDTVIAEGDVVIFTNQELKIRSDDLIYNKKNESFDAKGNIIINDKYDNNFFLKKLSSEDNMKRINGEYVRIRLEDDARIVGTSVIKEDDINIINDAEYTPCKKDDYLIESCPGWKLKSKRIYHDNIKKTIYYDHARLHLFNIPIFYTPFFSHPDPSVKKRSGLLMPNIQDDNQLGTTFALPIFLNLKSNQDLTFTPNIQTKSNNFYGLNYRFLNDSIRLDLETSIDDNDDKSGSSNHIFFDSEIFNELGAFNLNFKTTNNDTYMRKNKINYLKVLKSGINFNRETEENFFSIDAIGYRHLTEKDLTQWEYLFPKIVYNVDKIDNNSLEGTLSLKNELSVNRNLNKSYISLASSQVDWNYQHVHRTTGILSNNEANLRIISISIDEKTSKDSNNIRFYPQISSKLSYPLLKSSPIINQTLTPIVMPILAPYNNYTDSKIVTNSDLFSTNRATSIEEWEGGPRINYGLEWFISSKNNLDAKLVLGQNYKLNKNNADTNEELSDYFFNSSLTLGISNYLNNSIIIDKDDLDVKTLTASTFNELGNIIFAINYDYTSAKYSLPREQLAIGGKYNFEKNFFLKFTGSKNIDTNKNIGYQYGLLYENDCLAIDFNYYRDLTIDRDIEESDGISFTIVLKPFGTANNYGKKIIFGPEIE